MLKPLGIARTALHFRSMDDTFCQPAESCEERTYGKKLPRDGCSGVATAVGQYLVFHSSRQHVKMSFTQHQDSCFCEKMNTNRSTLHCRFVKFLLLSKLILNTKYCQLKPHKKAPKTGTNNCWHSSRGMCFLKNLLKVKPKCSASITSVCLYSLTSPFASAVGISSIWKMVPFSKDLPWASCEVRCRDPSPMILQYLGTHI